MEQQIAQLSIYANSTFNFTSTLKTMGQMIVLVVIFAVVLFLAYYATKLIAGYKQTGTGNNLEIIESMPLGNQGAIQIIRAGGKFLLLGITKEKITILTELDPSYIDVSKDSQNLKSPIFVEEYIKKFKSKENNNGDDTLE